jgi:hypothetical protein
MRQPSHLGMTVQPFLADPPLSLSRTRAVWRSTFRRCLERAGPEPAALLKEENKGLTPGLRTSWALSAPAPVAAGFRRA